MARLPLTMAAMNVDRARPLFDGRVIPEGIDLNFLLMDPEETFWRMTQFLDFHASEMSGTAYIIERSRPNPRFIALPVFLSRMFRHNGMYVHAGAGIKRPEDLRGRKVGIPEYNLTAVVWMRGILQHEYGVHPREVHWLVGGQEQPGRKERAEVKLPPDVRVDVIPAHETLNDLLDRGEIDALLAPRLPRPFIQGSPNTRRLFDDPWSVEEEYYKRTGIFPIMHIMVIRQDVYEANPWVAQSLYKAFCEAKHVAQEELYDATAVRATVPWLLREIERSRAVFGGADLMPYGLEASRPTLESLFAPATLDEFRI